MTLSEEINRLSSSLREVILYIKYASDEERLSHAIEKNDRFKNMDIKAARVIDELMNCNLQLDKERGNFNMCKALDDMKRRAHAEGVETGIEQGIEQGEFTGIMNLMDSMKWTAEQAMDALKISMDKRTIYKEKLQ